MSDRTLVLSGDRKLVISSLDTSVEYTLHRPFVVLLPAFDVWERQQVEAKMSAFMDLGCIEFCCVGPQAEQLHDSLDGIIEDRGKLELITTSDTDYSEACEDFLFAAGGMSCTLLALISSHSELSAVLCDMAKEA